MSVLLTRPVIKAMLAWLEAHVPGEIAQYVADEPDAAGLPQIAQYLDAEPAGLPHIAQTPALLVLATDVLAQLDAPGYFETAHPLTLYVINGNMDAHAARMSLYDYVAVLVRLVTRTRFDPANPRHLAPPPPTTALMLGNPQGAKFAGYSPTYSPRENDFYVDAFLGLTAIVNEVAT